MFMSSAALRIEPARATASIIWNVCMCRIRTSSCEAVHFLHRVAENIAILDNRKSCKLQRLISAASEP